MDRLGDIFDEMSVAETTGNTPTEEVIPNSMDPTEHQLVTAETTPRDSVISLAPSRISPSENYPRRDEKFQERLCTFNNGFPQSCPIPPEQLALAGFRFYSPEIATNDEEMSDTVRCDYCKGRLQRWEASDDPLEEHHRHYPRCPFLIPLIQETHNPDWAEYGTRLRSFEEANWNASHSTPSAEELASAGFHFVGGREMRTHQLPGANQENPVYRNDATKCFHCSTTLHSWEADDDVWVEHAKWSNNCGFLIAEKGLDFVHQHNPPTSRPATADLWREEQFSILLDDDSRFHQMVPSPRQPRQSEETIQAEIVTANLERPSDPLPPANPINPAQGYTQLLQILECKVCMNARSSVMFLPCHHISCCPECAKKLPEDRCPVCRAEVKYRLDAFIS